MIQTLAQLPNIRDELFRVPANAEFAGAARSTLDVEPYLVDRYSERKESAEALSKRVQQASI